MEFSSSLSSSVDRDGSTELLMIANQRLRDDLRKATKSTHLAANKLVDFKKRETQADGDISRLMKAKFRM